MLKSYWILSQWTSQVWENNWWRDFSSDHPSSQSIFECLLWTSSKLLFFYPILILPNTRMSRPLRKVCLFSFIFVTVRLGSISLWLTSHSRAMACSLMSTFPFMFQWVAESLSERPTPLQLPLLFLTILAWCLTRASTRQLGWMKNELVFKANVETSQRRNWNQYRQTSDL